MVTRIIFVLYATFLTLLIPPLGFAASTVAKKPPPGLSSTALSELPLPIVLPIALPLTKLSPRIHETKNQEAIFSIPPQIIEPFLSEPRVIEADALATAPRIIATEEDRINVGSGGTVYVSGIKSPLPLWHVFRQAKPLIDPQTQEILGYEAFFLGTAHQTREGEPALFKIENAKQEIGKGDLLTPIPPPVLLNYIPHPPALNIEGRVLSIYGGLKEAGRNAIITLNRGQREGMEVGHTLALYHAGNEREGVKLPDERYGSLFVFRVFERISYALVMNVTRPVAINDFVRTP